MPLERVVAAVRRARRNPHVRCDRPVIVVLCGSTRFEEEIKAAEATLTMEGKIVVGMGVFGVDSTTPAGAAAVLMLDDLHRHKIALGDVVFVVSDETGYIGESTRREISYGLSLGKSVEFANEATRGRWNELTSRRPSVQRADQGSTRARQ